MKTSIKKTFFTFEVTVQNRDGKKATLELTISHHKVNKVEIAQTRNGIHENFVNFEGDTLEIAELRAKACVDAIKLAKKYLEETT